MEKLFAWEVTILIVKINRFNILLKCIKPTSNSTIAYQGSNRLNIVDKFCQNPQFIFIAYAKSLFKNIYVRYFLLVNRFSKFVRHILGQNKKLNKL